MKTIYRTRKTAPDTLARDTQVIYTEDLFICFVVGFILSFVAFMWCVLTLGETIGLQQSGWGQTFKSIVLYTNLAQASVCGWFATRIVKPHTGVKQTRGAVLYEDTEVGGDGFKAMKLFLDDELKRQPGKAPALVMAAPPGMDILNVSQQDFKKCAPLSDDRSRTDILIIGGTGTGKSLTQKPLFHQAEKSGAKLVILDKKGEYTEEMSEELISLFGLHDRRQVQWAVARDLRTVPDVIQFLTGLIPVDSNQPYWGTAARLIGTAFFAHLLNTKPGTFTLSDFEQLTTLSVEEQVKIAIAAYPQAAPILQGEGQALASVLGNLAAFTAPLKDFAQEWEGSDYPLFSLSEWLEDPAPQKRCLIFQSGGRYSAQNDPLIRGCLTFMSSYIDSPMYARDTKEDPRSLWFFCDEFSSFGKLDTMVKNILERGRDKGARMCIAVQDVSQLREVYGDDFVKFLMSNVGTQILAGAQQGETADTFSKTLGQISFLKTHVSRSHQGEGTNTTVNEQEHQEEVITTSEIVGKLGFNGVSTRALYRFTRSPDAYIVHQPLIAYPRVNKAVVPADWVLGIPKKNKPADQATPVVSSSSASGHTQRVEEKGSPLHDEELPEYVDDLPPGYEQYEEDVGDIDENYVYGSAEVDETAAPVAAIAGVSTIEHTLSLIELLVQAKPNISTAKTIKQKQADIASIMNR